MPMKEDGPFALLTVPSKLFVKKKKLDFSPGASL